MQLSSTGFKAAAELWPEAFRGLTEAQTAEVMRGMRLVRPRLISGFETIPMVHPRQGVTPPHHPGGGVAGTGHPLFE